MNLKDEPSELFRKCVSAQNHQRVNYVLLSYNKKKAENVNERNGTCRTVKIITVIINNLRDREHEK